MLPEGVGEKNQAGIDYYNNLINALLEAGITPAVTLYHWDLPQALEDKGGWLSSEVADWFEEYARLCFTEFGDRVKFWITLNEPKETSIQVRVSASVPCLTHVLQGYGTGTMAPGIIGPGTTAYVAAHNQIRAHARAYRAYEVTFNDVKMKRSP